MLAARGRSSLTGAEVLDRGYERFTAKLRALGAAARRLSEPLGEPVPADRRSAVLRLRSRPTADPSKPVRTARPLQAAGAGRMMTAASPAPLAAVG